MVYHLYDVDSTDLSVDNLKLIMMDTLFVCLDYRNLAAHGGRIYNYRSDCNVRLENFSTDVSGATLTIVPSNTDMINANATAITAQ